MAEVSRISLDAPNIRSNQGAIMQPVVPNNSRLEDLPDGHRAYRADQGQDGKLYVRRDGNNFTGYGNFDRASRAFRHVIDSDPRQTVQTKYLTLGEQFESLRKEKATLEQVDADLLNSALKAAVAQDQRQAILAEVNALSSRAGFQPSPVAEDPLLNHIVTLHSKVYNRLKEIPPPVLHGWALVPYEY